MINDVIEKVKIDIRTWIANQKESAAATPNSEDVEIDISLPKVQPPPTPLRKIMNANTPKLKFVGRNSAPTKLAPKIINPSVERKRAHRLGHPDILM